MARARELEEINNKMETIYNLWCNTKQRDWVKVVNFYMDHPDMHEVKITQLEDTALHEAAVQGASHVVEQLVAEISKNRPEQCKKILSATNRRGDTPLHCAASSSKESLAMCKSILRGGEQFYTLVHIRNRQGETPLFLAALHGHKETFLFLHSISTKCHAGPSTTPWRNNKGGTILHCTLQQEQFDLSFQIIHHYRDQFIATAANERGLLPLHVLANKPSAFKSGTSFGWRTKFLYFCTTVKPLQVDDIDHLEETNTSEDKRKTLLPQNYSTCYGLFAFLRSVFRRSVMNGALLETRNSAGGQNTNFPLNYATCFEFFKSSYMYVFGLTGFGLSEARKIKEKHVWCSQILDKLVEQQYAEHYYGANGGVPFIVASSEEILSVKKNRPEEIFSMIMDRSKFFLSEMKKDKKENEDNDFLSSIMQGSSVLGNVRNLLVGDKKKLMWNFVSSIANDLSAQGDLLFQDIKDLMSCIKDWCLQALKLKMDDKEREMEKRMTPLLVATKNGVLEIVEKILDGAPVAIDDITEDKNILLVAVENRQPHIIQALMNHEAWDNLVRSVDNEGNNVLHLAAKMSTYKPSRIPGAAMQMQWETAWYQFVKEIIPSHLIFQTNNKECTPSEIFTESHKGLVSEANEWLKSTSESCSVVAALIAGVSFATSCTVPGGSNENTGKPTLEGQPVFNVFAISSLVALCFSVTALVMFLAILSSRQLPRDFRRDLPFKLLLGLSTLFVSIASMLVSFCAAHFFMVMDNMHKVVFIIYAATCLPVSLYAVAQFPLFLDLLKAIQTKAPRPTYKEDD